jgi:hypothetical protein
MNAKTHIEAVPTPAQLVREAIARRDRISEEITRIEQKLQFIIPIQAEEASAQSALNEVLRRDAEAMQAWMNDGALGAAPDPDKKARDAAIQKLGQASAKMQAAGNTKVSIEAEHVAAHQRYVAAQAEVTAAESQAMGDEFLRSAKILADAQVARLVAETHYAAAKDAMFATDRALAGALAQRASDIMRPLNLAEGRELANDVYQRAQHRFAALRAGEDPMVLA